MMPPALARCAKQNPAHAQHIKDSKHLVNVGSRSLVGRFDLYWSVQTHNAEE